MDPTEAESLRREDAQTPAGSNTTLQEESDASNEGAAETPRANESSDVRKTPVKNQENISEPLTGEEAVEPSSRSSRYCLLSVACLVFVALIVMLAVVLTHRTDDVAEPPPPPETVDYSTGVSLITYYGIEASIRSRLAQTKITLEVANALDCSSIHSITLQLPLSTRVASLRTTADDGCTANGVVEKLEDARESFLEAASEGLPGAYIEEQDSSTYSLQVAIPPLGSTSVELVLEELLRQRLGNVEFQIPFTPNEEVDSIALDLTVEDVGQGPTEFYLENLFDANQTSRYQLELSNAREYSLPNVLFGSYKPTELPENGVLTTDGTCFEHYFHPASLQSMPRNLLLILDTSAYMASDRKLQDAKTALKNFINTLTPEDTFAVQTFGNRGTESLWGSAQGTEEEKVSASLFIDDLRARGSNSNLHEAFLEGLLRARDYADDNDSEDKVTLLMMISNSRATTGERNRTKIAEDVFKLNRDGKVKIFSLGFQGSADMDLLDAIAIMNGGVSAPLLRGSSSFASGMESFFESEFGSVLLSDVSVNFAGRNVASTEKLTTFPLLADGYEIVIRGLLEEQDDGDDSSNTTSSFRAITSASTTDGITEWTADAEFRDTSETSFAKNTLCYQSYAHARITHLLRLRSAANFISQDMLEDLVTLSQPCKVDMDLGDCIKEEAESLALEANIVVKGITAMATVDDENCLSFEEEAEICLDGTTADGARPAGDDGYTENGGYDSDYRGYDSSAPLGYHSMFTNMILSGICLLCALRSLS